MADQAPPTNPAPAPATSSPAGVPKKSNATKLIVIILIILFVLFALGALGSYLVFRFVKHKTDTGIKQLNQAVQQLEQYPTAYKDAGLPQYPNGKVTSLSKQDATVHDGISLVVTTSDSSAKAAEYYDTQLKAKGWVADGEPVPFDTAFYYRNYKKGDQAFALTVQNSSQNNETTATITWNMAQ